MLQAAAVSEPPQKWFDSLLCSNKNMAVHEFFISNFWIKLFLTQYTIVLQIYLIQKVNKSNYLAKINFPAVIEIQNDMTLLQTINYDNLAQR